MASMSPVKNLPPKDEFDCVLSSLAWLITDHNTKRNAPIYIKEADKVFEEIFGIPGKNWFTRLGQKSTAHEMFTFIENSVKYESLLRILRSDPTFRALHDMIDCVSGTNKLIKKLKNVKKDIAKAKQNIASANSEFSIVGLSDDKRISANKRKNKAEKDLTGLKKKKRKIEDEIDEAYAAFNNAVKTLRYYADIKKVKKSENKGVKGLKSYAKKGYYYDPYNVLGYSDSYGEYDPDEYEETEDINPIFKQVKTNRKNDSQNDDNIQLSNKDYTVIESESETNQKIDRLTEAVSKLYEIVAEQVYEDGDDSDEFEDEEPIQTKTNFRPVMSTAKAMAIMNGQEYEEPEEETTLTPSGEFISDEIVEDIPEDESDMTDWQIQNIVESNVNEVAHGVADTPEKAIKNVGTMSKEQMLVQLSNSKVTIQNMEKKREQALTSDRGYYDNIIAVHEAYVSEINKRMNL